jgi:hypothetical protein
LREEWNGKAGSKMEGVQRDGYLSGHKYHGLVMMRVLEDEFRATVGGKIRE